MLYKCFVFTGYRPENEIKEVIVTVYCLYDDIVCGVCIVMIKYILSDVHFLLAKFFSAFEAGN